MAGIRAGDLYVSWSVRHALRLLSQANDGKRTSDSIADDVLTQWLQSTHAAVWTFVTEQQEREEAMVRKLKGIEPPKKKDKVAA